MARKKKSIVGAVADSVTEAVSNAIDALAHPADTVQQAVAVAKRKVAAKRRPARKAVRKVVAKARRKVAAQKKAVRKAVKKAAKKVRRR
jgi:hypothetical protein